MIKGAIFDMDGTLVANSPVHIRAFEIFCDRYGVRGWKEKLGGAFGRGNDDIMRLIMPEEVIREKGTAALGDEKEAVYREIYAPEIEPMPGLVALLGKLRDAGIRCAVGSSGCRANVDFVLEKCDIESFFDAKINGDMVTRCKPDPEIYLTAAAALGLAPAECVVFEDAKAGIESARRGPHRRAGVHALPPNAGRRNRRRRHHRRLPRHHQPRNIAEISARPRKRPPQFPTSIGSGFLSGAPSADHADRLPPLRSPTQENAPPPAPRAPFATSSALPSLCSSRIRDSAGRRKYFPEADIVRKFLIHLRDF